jgi:hypothetical protein
MKKLSTIIALALILTIGGVYAAWHYNRGAVSLEISRSATMASIQSDTSKGSISIDQTANSGNGNTLKFLVDDVAPQDYVAALVPSGSVWVKFTPAANADQAVKDNGIAMKATITVGGTQDLYGGKKIFSAKEGSNSFVINSSPSLDSVEITAKQIADCLNFNEGATVVLDTYEDNVAYETAMKTYIIIITIAEA